MKIVYLLPMANNNTKALARMDAEICGFQLWFQLSASTEGIPSKYQECFITIEDILDGDA